MCIETNRLCLGAISGARGIKGEIRIKTFTAEAINIAAYGPLTDETGTREMVIETVRPIKDGVIATIRGVRNRTTAENLKGLRLYVDRVKLPATEKDEFYHADLIGLVAELETSEVIGTVSSLHNFGAGELIEIKREGQPSVFLPFTAESVPSIDIEGGRIVVVIADDV